MYFQLDKTKACPICKEHLGHEKIREVVADLQARINSAPEEKVI